MSYKFDSLIIILNKLDSKENVTVHSLMDSLEVSQRSVYRYIKTLQVAKFPIHYNRQKGIYSFDDGYSLKKPNLSISESLAFALAKDALRNFGTGMEDSLSSIENKLSIKKGNISNHIILKTEFSSTVAKGYLEKVCNAAINFRRVEISYKAPKSKSQTERKLDPYYIFCPEGYWMLRAYCHLRKEVRTFALDRITSLKVVNENFEPRNISPSEELSDSFGTWLDGKPVKVILRFDSECKPYILRRKWHKSQKIKELKSGKLEVQFKVTGLEDIQNWIYKWLPYVEIVSPKKLKDTVKATLNLAIKKI